MSLWKGEISSMGLSMTTKEFLCSLLAPGISLHSIMLLLFFFFILLLSFLGWGGEGRNIVFFAVTLSDLVGQGKKNPKASRADAFGVNVTKLSLCC